MSKRCKQAISGALLVVPILVVAALAMVLLAKEGWRLEGAGRAAAVERAGLIAQTVGLAMAETKSEILTSLAKLPEESLAEELALWQEGSPYVGHAFVFSPGGEVKSVSGAGADPHLFVRGDDPVWANLDKAREDLAAGDPIAAVRSMKQNAAWKATLEVLSRMQPRYGWVYGEGGRSLRLAVWYRENADADVRGIEVAVAPLGEALGDILPESSLPDQAFAMVGAQGDVVRAVGDYRAGQVPVVAIPIGAGLPGWELRGCHLWEESSGANVFLFGSMVVVLLAGIAIGGGLYLLRQSRRDAHLALQKSTFVSNVSHELKTPLTSIRMSAEVLSEGRVKDPERVARHLGVIAAESKRLTRLVNNVLDLSQLEEGRKGFRSELQNVVPTVEESLGSQRVALAAAGMELKRGFDARDEIEAVFDPDAIGAVLGNLIDNSIKYAAEGEQVSVGIERVDGVVRIVVGDGGPGVPASQREAIFERFHRVDDALTGQSGAGLGLSIARKLARGMGGDLCYRDGEGGGAQFELSLPGTKP